MELNRLVGLLFLAAGLGLVTVAVAYFDWRAGLLTVCLLLVAAGVQLRRSASG